MGERRCRSLREYINQIRKYYSNENCALDSSGYIGYNVHVLAAWNQAAVINIYTEEKAMGVASLVLGIISIVISVFGTGSFGWLGLILGIIGIVLGVEGKKVPEQAGMAKAGFICSIIGVVLSLLFYIACIGCVGCLGCMSAFA